MTFTILTISGRPHLLPSVARSIDDSIRPAGHDVRWVVKLNPLIPLDWKTHIEIWDGELRRLTNTFFILLSDDNALHPLVIQRWAETIALYPDTKAIHVRQQHGPFSFRPAELGHLAGGYCDGGQVIFDADYFNSFGMSYDALGYEGHLFRHFHDTNPSVWKFLDETLAYHDRLKW